jgi:hypothetical protein
MDRHNLWLDALSAPRGVGYHGEVYAVMLASSGIQEYNYLVRVKTSITLPKELIGRLDRVDRNRSALLERAALAYLARLERRVRERKDIEIIDRNAERLNREALDTLEYQQLP